MKRLCLAILSAGFALSAHAVGRLADISIIDRTSGREVPTYLFNGEYWVAGAPGTRYAIQIHNALGERLLAVTAVDGVNALSGDTASWDQTGYVFGPRQRYQIEGWRKSSSEVADFEFTALSNAYATRTGRPENVGVIGIALFRERNPVVVDSEARASRLEAPAAPAPSPYTSDSLIAGAIQGQLIGGVPQSLGTGHGQREYSRVYDVAFERLHAVPDEVVHIRYDSQQNLVAMGVIPTPQRRLPSPNPFPDSPVARYVPDPPIAR